MQGDFRVNDWLVQPQLNLIVGSGRENAIEPKVMEVLVYLAERPGEVLHKERIIQSVWADTFVTDDVLIHAVSELRKAFGDDAKNPHVIQTIAKKGYCLIASVTKAKSEEDSRYRIVKKLGQGGMGEVFLANDRLLHRNVALKFIREDKESDKTYKKRLLREARSAAALDHPSIAKIHDMGEREGKSFIVMEYVEGVSLREMLARGPLTMQEALRITVQMAEALEEAHNKGIVHRDFKPTNVNITSEGKVKVLDFGLAKAIDRVQTETEQSSIITITEGTQTGVIVGTTPYMSPEQARGQTVDKQTDIWAFGCVLYECLVGQRPFDGATPTDTLGAIMETEPDWVSLPNDTPAAIRSLLRRCIQKEKTKRLHDIADARAEIEDVMATPEGELTTTMPSMNRASWRLLLPWALACLILGAVIGVGIWNLQWGPEERPSDARSVSFEIHLPEGKRLAHFYRQGVALSPDGTQLAFVSGTRTRGEKIYLRQLDQWTQQPIPGTENGGNPFFSPDGKWLGFVVWGDKGLFKVSLSLGGGDPEEICKCAAAYGIVWGPDDRIYFGSGNGRIFRVSASGGEPEEITQLDEEAGEVSHRLPHVLPNNQAVLFTALRYKPFFDNEERAQIFVQSLETGERKLIIEGGSDARYVPTGHVVFARTGRLLAVPFDLERLEVTGPEVPVLDAVNHSINTGDDGRETGVAQFSFSTSGMLAYVPGSVYSENKSHAVWVDRQGRQEPLEVEPRQYLSGRVSPDGQHVLLTRSYPPNDVWLFDRKRKLLRRQTFEGDFFPAVWGPGPDHFTFLSHREGPSAFFTKKVDSEPGQVEKLRTVTRSLQTVSSWSPDGQRLAFPVLNTTSEWDISIMSRDGTVEPFLQTRFSERYPEFSPDGRWIAYSSNRSQRQEIYVRPSTGPGQTVQLSTQGGSAPAWSRDGREVFYRQDRKFFAVKIDIDGNDLTAGPPTVLFEDADESRYGSSTPVRSYDVAPDGRFLVLKYGREEMRARFEQHFPNRIRIVQNWFEEIKRGVPKG